MSLNSPMLSRHSADVAARFGESAASYELNAGLQRAVADRLARLLPELERPRVLELGCGTGLFSRHLVRRYPQGSFVLTDVAPAMIAECRRNLAARGAAHISYEVMDAGEAGGHADLDLIVSSMTLHWLADPAASLERLRLLLAPGGSLLYATLGPESFAEWRATLRDLSLPSGIAETPMLPGVVEEERVVQDASTLAFLRRMKAVGGLTPREGYASLAAGALRRAIRAADLKFGGRITWHIVYGRLSATAYAPTVSRPSIIPA